MRPVGSVTATSNRTEGALALAPEPIKNPEPIHIAASTEDYDPSWETMADPDPEATIPGTGAPATEASQLQSAAVEALFATKKHNSAAEQLEETTWTVANGEVQIATTLSRPLMATIFRPDVEAIIKTALREKGLAGARLAFIPASIDNQPKAPKKPRTGSVQAKALEHPTVQQAQRLFNAEITNVFDLRKD